MQTYHRGMGYISERAAAMSRIPAGHPEGLYEAFANMYKSWNRAVLAKANNEPLDGMAQDFPTIDDGIEGVKFIHAAVESSKKDAAWVEL